MRLISIACMLTVFVVGTTTLRADDPFQELADLVAKKQGWTSNRTENAKVFYLIQDRLGMRFHAELLRFIGSDIDRHFNTAMFLSADYYLKGRSSDDLFALLIYHQGLSMLANLDSDDARREEVPFNVDAAILSWRLGFRKMAVGHKHRVTILLKRPECRGTFPAIDDKESTLYDAIPEN